MKEKESILRDYAEVKYEAPSSMVRTQIYLSRAEHEFLQRETVRLGQPMASLIRGYIDEKMNVPVTAWQSNPLLEPTPVDPAFEGHADSSINHDHYAYGAPKAYVKRGKKWVPAPKA